MCHAREEFIVHSTHKKICQKIDFDFTSSQIELMHTCSRIVNITCPRRGCPTVTMQACLMQDTMPTQQNNTLLFLEGGRMYWHLCDELSLQHRKLL